MRVFVTGATGFVGSAVVNELIDAGHRCPASLRPRRGPTRRSWRSRKAFTGEQRLLAESVLLVISPYTRRRMIEHRHFQTASVLKALEQILGMGSLTYFDDRAPSLLVDFEPVPKLDPYTALQPAVSLTEMNTSESPGAAESLQ